jgi:polyhydroxyalkanoate synthase subunit PhaE
MKNVKDVMGNMADATTKSINNWVETAGKAQQNMMSGKAMEKNSELYQEWLNKQMNIFRNNDASANGSEKKHEGEANGNPQEYFTNWYNQQMEMVKKMTDFNQQMYTGWMNMMQPNNQQKNDWTNMFGAMNMNNNWMTQMNSMFENMRQMMTPGVNKDAFANMFQSQQIMMKMQEFYQPLFNMMKNGASMDNWKNMMNMEDYKKTIENMFSSFFPAESMKEAFENYTKTIEDFFKKGQEMNSESWEAFQASMKQYPEFFNGDVNKMMNIYQQMNETIQKSINPVMNMIAPGKEKERMETAIETLDKMAVFSIKQAQMQYLIYTAGNNAMQKSMEMVMEKYKNNHEVTSFQQFYSEWVALNEKVFTELFASDEYAAVKADSLALGLTIKKDIEKQIELNMSAMPVAFRSEMEEVYKIIHDLKKKVRTLESRLAEISANNVEIEEEVVKPSRSRKSTK